MEEGSIQTIGVKNNNLLKFLLGAGAALAAFALAGLGFELAAVTCFGANGGLSVEGRKSKIGARISSTLYSFAISLPLSSGTHVPVEQVSSAPIFTPLHHRRVALALIFPIPPLHLLMQPPLHLPLQNPRPLRLVVVCYLQDLCRIQPSV